MKTNHISKYIVACMLATLPFTIFSCNKEEPDQPAGQDKPNQGQTGGKDDPDNGNGEGTPSTIELPEVSFSDTEDLLAYIDEAIDVCFDLMGEISETLEVSFASDGKSAIDGTFNPAAGKGSVSVTLSAEAQRSASTVSVILKDGEKEKAFDFEVTAYYLDITASSDDIVFSGEGGESKNLEYTVETNIADFVPKVTVDADWLSYADGVLTTSADNMTGEVRTTTVLIADEDAHFEGASVSVTQEFIIVDPEGCVRFADPAFRAAMASIADRDGDGFVSYYEALAVTEIVAVGKGIRDLTGLDAFTNVWKLDLQNNDIEDATVLKELPHLYWLDLKGNKNLKTFDVTGCSFYFEHCEFDVNENLLYHTARRQINVSYSSDDYPFHFSSHEDLRESVDYSRQNVLHILRQHTKGNGKISVIITGLGYIDIDFLDGTWDRIVDDYFSYLINDYPDLQPYLDYIDIYSFDHISKNRYQYITAFGELTQGTEHYKEVKEAYYVEYYSLFDNCYQQIYGPIERVFGQEPVIDKEIKLCFLTMDTVPIPNLPNMANWFSQVDAKRLSEEFENAYHSSDILARVSGHEDNVYHNYSISPKTQMAYPGVGYPLNPFLRIAFEDFKNN